MSKRTLTYSNACTTDGLSHLHFECGGKNREFLYFVILLLTCRSSLQLNESFSWREKDNSFISRAAWLSIEINIHCLTSIIILVSQGILPSSALNVHLFSSQPCEATFRSARSLSSTFSSITNFSVFEFINKIEKISILNNFKSSEMNTATCPIKFPIHHKNKGKETTSSGTITNLSSTTISDIESVIMKAYHRAEKIMDVFQLLQVLKDNNISDIKTLSSFVFFQLDSKTKVDYCYFNEADLQDDADDIDNSQGDIEADYYDFEEENLYDNQFTTSKETFHGMRIFDKIDPSKTDNYFHIMINNEPKFLHKQTATRLLATNKNCLSSDRLSRVKQTHKQN